MILTDPLLRDLWVFVQEHEYCGELASDVEVDRVWVTCTCGAMIVRPLEPAT
jgi:hypothetical protein